MVDEVKKDDAEAKKAEDAKKAAEAPKVVDVANTDKIAKDDEAARAEENRRRLESSQLSDRADLNKGKSPAKPEDSMTVEEAKLNVAHLPTDMEVGDHMAQHFSNDPANPAPAKGVSTSPDSERVLLSRKRSGEPNTVYARVPPEMVGDYLRAGWNVD